MINDKAFLLTFSTIYKFLVLSIKCLYFSGFVPVLPRGLVNFNYGFHGCVHLGNEMDPNQSAKEPTRVSFPASPDKYHTIVFVDAALFLGVFLFVHQFQYLLHLQMIFDLWG